MPMYVDVGIWAKGQLSAAANVELDNNCIPTGSKSHSKTIDDIPYLVSGFVNVCNEEACQRYFTVITMHDQHRWGVLMVLAAACNSCWIPT